jgi:TatD DNase family protein
MGMKKRMQPKQAWIIHGFRGKPELAKQLLKMGFNLSFGEKFNPLSVDVTPLNQLCIETDTSFMKIEDIYQTIAGIKACQPSELNAGCQILKLFYC